VDSVWTREDPKRRSTLSREAIVRAAMEVADAEGLDAVSIRRVATVLGARAMSLYTYIARKEDLFDLMADEASAELHVPDALPADWREATVVIARRERATAHRHPWIVQLATRRKSAGLVGPNSLRHLEQSLEALDSLDGPPALKWRVMAAVADYSSGFIQRELGAVANPELLGHLRKLTESGRYPRLATMLEGPFPAGDEFETGLRWLLNGITA
jgi:AcrR family transcriptional regulator